MYSNHSWMVLASRLLMIALLIIIAICRSSTLPLGAPFVDFLVFHFRFIYRFSFIASMLLVGWQEGHPTCKILVVVINFTGDLYYNRYWHLRSHDNVTVQGEVCLRQRDSSWSLDRCFISANGIYYREMLVGGTEGVQVHDPCSLTVVSYKWVIEWLIG